MTDAADAGPNFLCSIVASSRPCVCFRVCCNFRGLIRQISLVPEKTLQVAAVSIELQFGKTDVQSKQHAYSNLRFKPSGSIPRLFCSLTGSCQVFQLLFAGNVQLLYEGLQVLPSRPLVLDDFAS